MIFRRINNFLLSYQTVIIKLIGSLRHLGQYFRARGVDSLCEISGQVSSLSYYFVCLLRRWDFLWFTITALLKSRAQRLQAKAVWLTKKLVSSSSYQLVIFSRFAQFIPQKCSSLEYHDPHIWNVWNAEIIPRFQSALLCRVARSILGKSGLQHQKLQHKSGKFRTKKCIS